MAETSIFGIQSGFDTAEVVDKLIELQGRPIELKLAQVEIEEAKLESFQDLKSRLQTFKSILAGLNTESRFLSNQGTFSKLTGTGDVVSVNPTSLATSGTFSLEVTQLAREGKIVSDGFASISDPIQQGIFEITVGGTTTFIQVDSTNNTLDGLRLAINNSGAAVQASLVDDGDPNNPIRLVLSGTQTGTANSVSARLFTTGLGTGEIDVMTFTETQSAQDAIIKLDGIDITKSSNTVSDVIAGTILTLESTGTGTVNVETDRDGIRSKVLEFVDGYNDLIEFLQEELSFDTETFETGNLFGNFTVQNLQNSLRGLTTNQVQGISAQFSFLSQVGITTEADGTLVLDTAALDTALLNNPQNVSQLFASKGRTTNPAVTFVGFTDATAAGSYEVRVLGGVPQLRKVGDTNFVSATGSGSFFAGAPGTDAEGLNFRISSLIDGDYGRIDLSLGVAEQLNRAVGVLLDTTRKGPLEAELDTITATIDSLNDTIFDMDERLELFEKNIKREFINLEVLLGRLNTQRQAFGQSIENISGIFNRS